MAAPDQQAVTQLLNRLLAGDAQAEGQLMPRLYGELHAIAEAMMMQGPPAQSTLQPTALVHEAWLRIVGGQKPELESRAHFAGLAARVMRNVLVDHERRKRAEKRGGAALRFELDDVANLFAAQVPDLLAFDEALERLARVDPQLARLVELRFFGGLSIEETAAALAVSQPTVTRHWRVARIWLQRELEEHKPGP